MSILIPVHEGAPHLRATVRSALDQSIQDIEVVALDDGSRDASAAILAEYRTDARVRLLRHDRVLGAAATWNELVDAAAGEHVVLLPQDDLLDPDAIERRLDVLDAYPGAIGVLARHRLIDARGRRIGPTGYRLRDVRQRARIVSAPGLIVASARIGGNVAGPPATLLVRRSALRSLRYREEAGYAIDLDLVVRLAATGELIGSPRRDCSFRVHGGAWTQRLRRRQVGDFVRLIVEAGSRLPPDRSLPRLIRVRATVRTWIRRAVYSAVRAAVPNTPPIRPDVTAPG